MNAGARASRGEVLVFLHADTAAAGARAGGDQRGARRDRARLGPLRRAHRGRRAAARPRGRGDEPALAPDGHRHRRPGDLRAPRGLRGGRRIPRDRAHGGRGAVGGAQARLAARLPARARRDFRAALGAARDPAHHRAHVAPAARLRPRRRSRSASHAATMSSAPRPETAVAVFAKAPVAGRGEDAPGAGFLGRRRRGEPAGGPRAPRARHGGAGAHRSGRRSGALPTRAIRSSRAAATSSARGSRRSGATISAPDAQRLRAGLGRAPPAAPDRQPIARRSPRITCVRGRRGAARAATRCSCPPRTAATSWWGSPGRCPRSSTRHRLGERGRDGAARASGSRRAGARWIELPALWDVDRPEDYARLQRDGLLAEVLS